MQETLLIRISLIIDYKKFAYAGFWIKKILAFSFFSSAESCEKNFDMPHT